MQLRLQMIFCLMIMMLTEVSFAARTIVSEAVVTAPVADVWKAFTTSEGFESWAVAHAEIDLRIGGDMRTHYNPKGILGDDGTIVNRIISLEPERMLSIQNVQAPKGFKNAELFQKTWTVIHFDPIDSDRTRVRCVGLGFGDGPEWDALYNKFKAGNAYTLEQLRKKFQTNSANDDSQRVMELLKRLTGGEWIHQSASEGSVFRVRNVIELGPDGQSVSGSGWLGDDSGMFLHSHWQAWLEPGANTKAREPRFQNVDQDGTITRGRLHLQNPDTLEYDWASTTPEGKAERYRVSQAFKDQDHYHLRIERQDESGAWGDMVNADFQRVAKAPAEFLKMRAN